MSTSSSLQDLQPILKLDFNERSDKLNPLADLIPIADELWRYPDRQPLEKRIAELNNLDPSQVLCTNGGDEAIMILMRILKERESEKEAGKSNQLILPLPAFSQYTWGVKSWNLDPIYVQPLDNLAIDFDSILSLVNKTSKAITVLTRPNNPTGESITNEKLVMLISASKKNGGWVFLDEAYIEFSDEQSAADDLIKQFDNLIVLRTFSKAFGLAGARLGYILGDEKVINEFKERCAPFNLPSPSIAIGLTALEDANQKEMNDYCQVIKRNRDAVKLWFEQNGIEAFPSQANFILIKLAKNQAKAVKSFMAKNNVLIRGFSEGELENCLRITIPYNLERLLPLLEQCLKPKLICIDMDGVLIDTSESYDLCVIATVKKLSRLDVSIDSIEKLRKQGGYNNDWVLSKKLLSNLGFELDLETVTSIFQSEYLGDEEIKGLVENEKMIISKEFVESINQSRERVFTVVTGRPRKEALSGQKMINLSKLDLISLDDVKQGKPSPEGIQKLQKQYSTLSWMCGDNPDDMQASVASNSLAIGIGTNKVDALYDAGADVVLDSINELKAWL